MRPTNLTTKVFLDSGDPAETRRALWALGFLDGQTTNPSLVAKNPDVVAQLARGEKFRRDELLERYRAIVAEISGLIPQGSVSVEVYADRASTADDLFRQTERMFTWIPNAHVKLPITAAGIAAARAVPRGMRINMTLCFTQAQAAAVHAATRGAQAGDVFISPFVGRLYDQHADGMALVWNILEMYRAAKSHVAVLTASVRTLRDLTDALALGSDIVTAPLKVIEEWAAAGMPAPERTTEYRHVDRFDIPYVELDCARPWDSFDLHHDLTDAGLDRFANDWNALIAA